MASADEDRTLARLRALRADLIDPTIAAQNGRVFKRTGDGALVEFRSVVEAVRCAITIQNAMIERNVGTPTDQRIVFRMGIHLGDVVEESDGDLMGDGVNIAARLEGIAEPGAICLSEQAYWQVKGRLDLAVTDLGPTQLKNIAEPVRAYSLQVGVPAQAKPAMPAAPAVPAKPAVAEKRPTLGLLGAGIVDVAHRYCSGRVVFSWHEGTRRHRCDKRAEGQWLARADRRRPAVRQRERRREQRRARDTARRGYDRLSRQFLLAAHRRALRRFDQAGRRSDRGGAPNRGGLCRERQCQVRRVGAARRLPARRRPFGRAHLVERRWSRPPRRSELGSRSGGSGTRQCSHRGAR